MQRSTVSILCAIGIIFFTGVHRSSAQSGTTRFPQATLRTSQLTATLFEPDSQQGYYRSTRFDWSGLVSKVMYANHTFFSEFRQTHDPLNHDDICGTAEEFGIESPPSFAQAKPGEPFIKIGIGVLERLDASDYAFWQKYKIRTPGYWRIENWPYKINYRQNLHGPGGWGYDYTKVVELVSGAPELKITRHLKNTGTQSIDTAHYGHNFMQIDSVPAGTNYTLEFPFEPQFGSDSRTQGCVGITNRSLYFTKNPGPDQAIWVRLEGFKGREDNAIKIVNHLTGAAMTITTDQPLSKLAFYSSGGVLCPEPFVKVNIAPGQTQQWSTTYRFEAQSRVNR